MGAAAVWILLRIPAQTVTTRPDDEGPLGRSIAGFRFLLRENERVLAAVTLTAAGPALVTGAWYTLIVVLCARSFHLGAQSAGFIDATWAAGGVAGSFLIAGLPRPPRFGGLFIAGAAASSVSIILFGLSPAGLLPFIVVGLSGIADIFVLVDCTTVLRLPGAGRACHRDGAGDGRNGARTPAGHAAQDVDDVGAEGTRAPRPSGRAHPSMWPGRHGRSHHHHTDSADGYTRGRGLSRTGGDGP